MLSSTPDKGKQIRADQWTLEYTFLDVGQGDAGVISLRNLDHPQESVLVMLDGGCKFNLDANRAFLQSRYPDKAIDVVIAGSTDRDHFGGLIEGPDRYVKLGAIYLGNKSKSPFSQAAQSYHWIRPTGAATENLWDTLGRPAPAGAPNLVR